MKSKSLRNLLAELRIEGVLERIVDVAERLAIFNAISATRTVFGQSVVFAQRLRAVAENTKPLSQRLSASIRERVEAARQIQRDRYRRASIQCNAEMTTRHMRRACELDPSSRRLLISAIERLGLSARAHDRILKVARTIADLAGEEHLSAAHVAEAVQYRALDRAYFR